MTRPTQAVIDLGRIRRNLLTIRDLVGPTRKILVAVKADAYGHGAVPVARTALQADMDQFGVATVAEGVELRQAGIRQPVVILGHILPAAAAAAVAHGITITVATRELAGAAAAAARAAGRRAAVVAHIDTGMGRIGLPSGPQALAFIAELVRNPDLVLSAVFSHFPTADEADKTFCQIQLDRFRALQTGLDRAGIAVPPFSIANGAAVLDLPDAYLDLVRPGIIVYGLRPSPHVSESARLEPALTWKTRVVFTKRAAAGTTLGYGRAYTVAADDSLVATLPVGYADGYSRILSNRGPILINGRRYRVSGRVSMDQLTVDLGPDGQCRVGDEAVLLGSQGAAQITAAEVAAAADTIVYEIMSRIASRVHRVWIEPDAAALDEC